jgi:hypothetical protein
MVQRVCRRVRLLDVWVTGEQLVEQLRAVGRIAAWVGLERNGEQEPIPLAQLRGVR